MADDSLTLPFCAEFRDDNSNFNSDRTDLLPQADLLV
jgi:hypothetical protein